MRPRRLLPSKHPGRAIANVQRSNDGALRCCRPPSNDGAWRCSHRLYILMPVRSMYFFILCCPVQIFRLDSTSTMVAST
jgi:hypothetical protein